MLKFNGDWRFDSPGEISTKVSSNFFDLIGKIATQVENQQSILEHFKSYFAKATGSASSWSSSESWAQSDLSNYISNARSNAPLFIEAFYDACESLRKDQPEINIPSVQRINKILASGEISYQIQPPNLVSLNPNNFIDVAPKAISMDEQAQNLIQNSLAQSQILLSTGNARAAVQEILWLLETISTAFKGIETESGTVEGKYFNKIARSLREHHKGQALESVLNWITALHGFLSSPTGGGIRHGTDLSSAIEIQPNDARLYCNLIRSYIDYLLLEHHRLKKV